ncbi:LodA/GoxA family CTQ-dependent oxidase [Ferrimonas kyonanensis]|uniref:LodA/GoxA family CTQ-dependent oxidase n=1 Tax=Ferrimonas kyonanensis TaxID=364763 RepID=UPI0004106435|nr:LodA/GoxA family CTQ-dependent oxidase [Ferrimonas kyonanensis]
MSNQTYFRVHPAINFARVGNSDDFYIAPETAAGELLDQDTGLFGGLPIRWGTEDTPITAEDFRDAEQKVKRQAARFRIFAYDQPQSRYPSNDKGTEIRIGSQVGGKTVKDIIWTVHLANKKNNNFTIEDADGQELGIASYENGQTPPLRNLSYGTQADSDERRSKLVIDAGPRTICSSQQGGEAIEFDADTTPSYCDDNGRICSADSYPISFPGDHFSNLNPGSGDITTLGQLRIEPGSGRLVVTGGYGNAFAFPNAKGQAPTLDHAIDNDGWFDDVADGPVNATVVFDDGSTQQVVAGWFVSTDPAYAPQTRNVVSTWDDVFNTWVEELALMPSLFAGGQYNTDFPASFNGDVLPVLHGALLQRWNTNLPNAGVQGHNFIGRIKPTDDPKQKIPNFKALIRDPNDPAQDEVGTKMPLALGDAKRSFLSLSKTQYFLLQQWYEGLSQEAAPELGVGEKLDKVVLENCLGGRYSPGIDLTFVVRDVNLYLRNDDQSSYPAVAGPFRINQQPLDYASASRSQPFLGIGYIPLNPMAVEPGDLSKFMSQPWHTDYNSCAVHTPDPNPAGNNTLYWSWPAQRPVQVYPAQLCQFDEHKQQWNLGGQLFSVRGDKEGSDNLTYSPFPQNEGRYQEYLDFLANWHKTGFIIQGSQIPASKGGNYGSDKFLEVQSLYDSYGQVVQPWPTAALDKQD